MPNSQKIQRLKKTLDNIDSELTALAGFRQTKQLEQFKRQLHGERSFAKRQLARLEQIVELTQKARQAKRLQADMQRSEKMKRSWRYFDAIEKNYDLKIDGKKASKKKIRSEFTKRKRGLQSDIDDIVWRNPSP